MQKCLKILFAAALLGTISAGLYACGPFGAGPWYAIQQATVKDSGDSVGVICIVSGPEITALTNESATIEWEADLHSDSVVAYVNHSSTYNSPNNIYPHESRFLISNITGDHYTSVRVANNDCLLDNCFHFSKWCLSGD